MRQTIINHPTAANPTVENTAVSNSGYLRHLSDSEIRAEIVEKGADLIKRAFPGTPVECKTLAEGLKKGKADFTVVKNPLYMLAGAKDLDSADENSTLTINPTHCATARSDNAMQIGTVGVDYGIIQTMEHFEALNIMVDRGEATVMNIENVDGGARVRVTALLSVSQLSSIGGASNTLAHFAIFEATHNGSACSTATIYTLRVECFNGMTSREVTKAHKMRHSSKVGERMGAMTEDILTILLGDIEAEKAIFEAMIQRPMSLAAFTEFTTELLGGELDPNAGKSKKTRRAADVAELEQYFSGGNQGAGETAWGAFNSVTRWIEAKREGITDAKKAAKKFNSQLTGANQGKVSKALELLTA